MNLNEAYPEFLLRYCSNLKDRHLSSNNHSLFKYSSRESRSIRRWPPGVRTKRSIPFWHILATVVRCRPRRRATSPVVRRSVPSQRKCGQNWRKASVPLQPFRHFSLSFALLEAFRHLKIAPILPLEGPLNYIHEELIMEERGAPLKANLTGLAPSPTLIGRPKPNTSRARIHPRRNPHGVGV